MKLTQARETTARVLAKFKHIFEIKLVTQHIFEIMRHIFEIKLVTQHIFEIKLVTQNIFEITRHVFEIKHIIRRLNLITWLSLIRTGSELHVWCSSNWKVSRNYQILLSDDINLHHGVFLLGTMVFDNWKRTVTSENFPINASLTK